MLGEVPERDLPVLLSAATVFAFPSLYEGFGLPPLEAMACSTPVVCSNASSLPEVVGDAAMLCDPTDAIAWRTAIMNFLSNEDRRREMESHGLNRAADFRWDSVARSTRAVYECTLNT
jgi:glycosyltransferase involved in cell wall biosynthesis